MGEQEIFLFFIFVYLISEAYPANASHANIIRFVITIRAINDVFIQINYERCIIHMLTMQVAFLVLS